MAYSELIKNFEKVRAYMREFYVYGFKSRNEFNNRSARSYDDERRRIESWLGEYMRFSMSPEGKNVFLSVDSRTIRHNPFHKAWKTKSFTDGDITLHFIIFDILNSPEIEKSLSEIILDIDSYLADFDEPMSFDESTVRKKLKEYESEGLINIRKDGRKVSYSRASGTDLSGLKDAIDFYSEIAPCGVVGSYLNGRFDGTDDIFTYKHHYITQTIDSDIMAIAFDAIGKKRYLMVDNFGRRKEESRRVKIVPIKVYISTQNGRQYIMGYSEKRKRFNAYRLDYLSNMEMGEVCEEFDSLRADFAEREKYMWGVTCNKNLDSVEHVEFEVYVGPKEGHIVGRLEREKRCGRVEKVDGTHYRFVADVFDTTELVPWIRTFISRITKLNFDNRSVENTFREDIEKMYALYGIDGGDE